MPVAAQELGLLDVTGQMHFTDGARVQAFLTHVALPEVEQRAAAQRLTLVRKHGPDGPTLRRLYDEGGGKGWAWKDRLWFDKEDDVSKWHGVSVDGEGRLAAVNLLETGIDVEKATRAAAISKELQLSLCGIARDQAEADFKKQGIGPAGAILVAASIVFSRSLSNVFPPLF